MSTEWNATQYHEVSEPQFQWGLAVLDRLVLAGNELVLDAGCGSGRLTARLLERLPRGRVVAVDRSSNMLQAARDYLTPRFGRRVSFVQSDAAHLALQPRVDVIFSTATFHWVLDHERLFRSLRGALRAGGLLHAQCGGGRNLERILTRAGALMAAPEFAPYFRDWREPTLFADPVATAARLARAGFIDVGTSLEASPATFRTADEFALFLSVVVLRPHLARLPVDLGNQFISRLVAQAAHDDPPYTLDYWRLNLRGRVPAG